MAEREHPKGQRKKTEKAESCKTGYDVHTRFELTWTILVNPGAAASRWKPIPWNICELYTNRKPPRIVLPELPQTARVQVQLRIGIPKAARIQFNVALRCARLPTYFNPYYCLYLAGWIRYRRFPTIREPATIIRRPLLVKRKRIFAATSFLSDDRT